MKEIIVHQIDSFTKEKFKGNPAGVVLNAEHLTDEEMQLIARELNNSETAFIKGSENDNYEYSIQGILLQQQKSRSADMPLLELYMRKP